MRAVWFIGPIVAASCCGLLAVSGCAAREEPNQDKKAPSTVSQGQRPKEPKPAVRSVDKPAEAGSAKAADAAKTPPTPDGKRADAPAADKPDADQPASANPPAGKDADAPAGNKPASAGEGGTAKAPSNDAPPGDAPAKAEPAKGDPPAAPPKIDVEAHMRLILDMVNRPRPVRKTPDFVAQFIVLADEVIASDASAGYKSTALLSKFKVLHEASADGNAGAQVMLEKLADAERENKGRRAAEFVRFVDAEKKLLAAKTLDAAAIVKLLEETKAYLAAEELSNRHLRMAQLAAEAVERLPEGERDAWYKTLGEQFARSVDLDLAYIGQRFGKPPVPPSALLGKPFELAGTITSGQALKWENYRDKIVLVDFWATWCTLCLDQEPRMKDVHAKYGSRGLEVVGVSIDASKEDLTRHLREHEIPWITLFGKEPQEVAAKYGVRGVPTLFLIDAEGKILMRSNSIAELEPHIKTHVEALEKKREEKRK
jgi:thiol-disulfide isomerase/thioredoxin